jgi:hypothetical protein
MPNTPRPTSTPANVLHSRLLDLHKQLLDLVRADYEREHGPIGGPGPLLQLVTQDPAFAWLRPLSMLLVEMDDPTEVARVGGVRSSRPRSALATPSSIATRQSWRRAPT